MKKHCSVCLWNLLHSILHFDLELDTYSEIKIHGGILCFLAAAS